jgi:signal transduction histidine kinase
MAAGEAAVTGPEAGEVRMASRELVHEFRNLLAVIVNYCELIAEETHDPAAVSADLQEIRIAAERALALTEKIPVPPKAGSSADQAPAAS